MTATATKSAPRPGIKCPSAPAPASAAEPAKPAALLLDARFRTLVGEEPWQQLPEAVQARFSKRLAPGETTIYTGHVLETRLSAAGRVLANVARLIGAPLPLTDGATGAAVVAVTEEPSLGGQTWTRCYARTGRFPQVVHSAKRFTGPTGLEEYVGAGVSMQLRVTVQNARLVFRSERYVLDLGRVRIRLPAWLSPGTMEIVHEDRGQGRFVFTLKLDHARLGLLLWQVAEFTDRMPDAQTVAA